MVPISSYYLDQDPPNHASVQKLLSGSNEHSSKESQMQQQSKPQQPSTEAGLSSENDASPTNPTSRNARARSETPPPPAPKDDPPAVPAAAIPLTSAAEEPPVTDPNSALGDSSVIIKEDEGAGYGDGTMEEIDLMATNGKGGATAPESGHSTEHYTTADAHTADVENAAKTDVEPSRENADDDDDGNDDEAGEEVDLS